MIRRVRTLAALALLLAAVPAVAADDPAIAPRTLRSVLEELCAREGVLLRYEGPSRWAPALDLAAPLADSLAALLDGVSYVQTVRRDPQTGAVRLTGLHVLGGDGGAADDTPRPGEPFAVKVKLLDAAFAGADRDDASVERLIADVRANPDRLEAFLATDTAMMAESLARYPDAARVLRTIAGRSDLDPRSRAKLEEILAALE
jgi:hypothetical protein